MSFADGPEVAMPAGDVTVGVVRIGDTVRRPRQDTSAVVASYLHHLEGVGFDGAPRFLGTDAQGRDVLTYLDGNVAGSPVEAWAAADDVLPGVARLARRLHDAGVGFDGPPPRDTSRPRAVLPASVPPIFAQRDITPQNTVFRAGQAWAVIDFDLSGWTTRATDLANTAMHWVPLVDPVDREAVYAEVDVGRRLRSMLDAYGRDAVDADLLLEAMRLRFAGAYEVMHWNAVHQGGGWARMWDEGVGEVILRRVAWFEGARVELSAALR